MKIEIGESLMLSWLRHVKGCQLVQLNWKPSTSSWDLFNEVEIEEIMAKTSKYFDLKYSLDIFKKNKSHFQLMQQGEIDALGVSFKDAKIENIYAVDIAFHESGLNYGDKSETISRVIKKLVRTAMIIYGYFDLKAGSIIFASPKVYNSVYNPLTNCLEDLNTLFDKMGYSFKFSLYVNDDFREKIFEPVISSASSVADTSELFMRSIQMYNIFADEQKSRKRPINSEALNYKTIEKNSDKGMKEMKIGALVRTNMRRLAKEGIITKELAQEMTKYEYSKRVFNINYPLLKKIDKNLPLSDQRKIKGRPRYWNEIFKIAGEEYFVCQEWYEYSRDNFINWMRSIERSNIK